MKHWMRDTFSPYFLITVLLCVIVVLLCLVALVAHDRLAEASEHLEQVIQGHECVNRTLVIEGCDKHGANCAPIYKCGGE